LVFGYKSQADFSGVQTRILINGIGQAIGFNQKLGINAIKLVTIIKGIWISSLRFLKSWQENCEMIIYVEIPEI